MKKNPQVDAYLAEAKNWPEIIAKLRTVLLAAGLTEDFKWAKPCYTHGEGEGGNIVIIQPFKAYCALLFFKGALLKDPAGLLVKTGENTRVGRQLRFTDPQQVTKQKAALQGFLQQAIEIEAAGLEVPDDPTPADSAPEKIPAELQAAFTADPALKKAFTALTPGRQRGYLFHFTGAKQSATRTARIEKCRPQILKGQGLHDWDKTAAKSKQPQPDSTPTPAKAGGKPAKPTAAGAAVKLLSGGNPQIPKGDGDAPVQAYIAAMPGWKREVGERLDLLITLLVPHVRKAVKWNSPFYGVEGQGWFLNLHVFTKYIRLTFFAGTSLKPTPPGHTPKSGNARWLDLHEADEFDEKQLITWIKQAVKLPGWAP